MGSDTGRWKFEFPSSVTGKALVWRYSNRNLEHGQKRPVVEDFQAGSRLGWWWRRTEERGDQVARRGASKRRWRGNVWTRRLSRTNSA